MPSYFGDGRSWIRPGGFIRLLGQSEWKNLDQAMSSPAVGSLRRDENDSALWLLANGHEESFVLRLVPPSGGSMVHSTLKIEPVYVSMSGRQFIEIEIGPLEIGAMEWKREN